MTVIRQEDLIQRRRGRAAIISLLTYPLDFTKRLTRRMSEKVSVAAKDCRGANSY